MSGETNYPGIDYGGGFSNVDRETGIRYGIIPINALEEWSYDSFEPDYGDPCCPKCGNEVEEPEKVAKELEAQGRDPEEMYDWDHCNKGSCEDYVCENCKYFIDSSEAFGDEPCSWTLDEDGYKGFIDEYNDVWILKSPYYTHAQFCSPCAPGAGHLGNPCENGPKVYCLGAEWFEGEKNPYPIYNVKTGELVKPTYKKGLDHE